MTPVLEQPLLPGPAAGRAARRGGVLIVDDRADKLITMEASLASLGHEIITAGSGVDALRCLLHHDVAVILLDMNMPGMDGFETARLIRSRRRNRDTPIIFVTSYGDDMHALQAYSLGAVDFILAPAAPEILRSKVGVFLELYERTAEVRENAKRLLRQTKQLQLLTQASLRIHSALSIEETLQFAADSACKIIGAPQTALVAAVNHSGVREQHLVVSPARRGRAARFRSADLDRLKLLASQSRWLSAGELRELLPDLAAEPPTATLAAPLVDREGHAMGVLLAMIDEKSDAGGDDESLLAQLAQMAATAVENTLFAEARESNRMKDEFLATLSHELRTPLSSVLGWAQLMKTKLLDPGEMDDAVDIIERNAQVQCKLIEDLLDVSRIITGKMQLNLRPIHLASVVRAAVEVVLPTARAKGVEIDVTTSEGATDRILGDADRLQQVFWNLLSNAVKFTAGPGRVELRFEADEAEARVIVCDDGEGIDPQFLPHVFDRFRQADSSKSRTHGGLGIGLAIVRHVVELHGGRVSVESEGLGKGTAFAVSLPLTVDDFATVSDGEAVVAGSVSEPMPLRADSNCEFTRPH